MLVFLCTKLKKNLELCNTMSLSHKKGLKLLLNNEKKLNIIHERFKSDSLR